MNAFAGIFGGRWPGIALAASLVLNGFLIGWIATDVLRPHHGRHGEGGPRALRFELRRLAETLPREAVDQIQSELEPLRPALQARLDKVRAIREAINLNAARPQPDRAVIDQQFAALRAEVSAMQEEVQRATFDALLKLPPEARASLAAKPSDG